MLELGISDEISRNHPLRCALDAAISSLTTIDDLTGEQSLSPPCVAGLQAMLSVPKTDEFTKGAAWAMAWLRAAQMEKIVADATGEHRHVEREKPRIL